MPEHLSAITNAQFMRIATLANNLGIKPRPIDNYFAAQHYIKYLNGKWNSVKRMKARAANKKNPLI